MVCPQILWGQTYFNMRYPPDSGTWASGSFSIVNESSGYFVSRWSLDKLDGTWWNKIGKLDANGNMISNTDSIHFLDKQIYVNSFKKSKGSTLYQAFTILDIGSGKHHYGMMKYDLNGKMIFHNMNTGQYQFVVINEIQELPDKNFIAVGTIQKSGTHPNDEEVFVVKMDSLGNELWQKSLWLGGNGHNGECIALCDDGGFIIGGAENDYTIVPKEKVKPVVVKLDGLGNIEWRKEYGSNILSNSPAYGILQTQDGGYVFVGGVGVRNDGVKDEKSPWIVKIDSLGDMIWNDTASTKDATIIDNKYYDILELDDGSLIACGQRNIWNPNIVEPAKFRLHGILSKYSRDGVHIWERRYRHPEAVDLWNTKHFLYDVEPTSDGGFVAAGWLNPSTDTTQDTWVIKVDSFGCLEPGCEVIGVPEIAQTIETLKIYPNPSKGILHIEITSGIQKTKNNTYEFQLYDMLGKRVYQTKLQPYMNTISVSDLPTGVYTYRLGTVRGMVVLE
ncbi:T9SS type A sorting domain-containing protein [bacterium SCSIO 12643]|nr:T9SS type A sorting domain-containing protein [bacterium SCSIO 12643]